MSGFERVVTDIAKGGYADVANRQPALEAVVAGAVEQVRDAHGGHGCRRFQAGETRRIVDYIVRDKNFLSPAGLEIASRRIVHAPSHRYSGEQPKICTIPESVRRSTGLGGWNCRQRVGPWLRVRTLRQFGCRFLAPRG